MHCRGRLVLRNRSAPHLPGCNWFVLGDEGHIKSPFEYGYGLLSVRVRREGVAHIQWSTAKELFHL